MANARNSAGSMGAAMKVSEWEDKGNGDIRGLTASTLKKTSSLTAKGLGKVKQVTLEVVNDPVGEAQRRARCASVYSSRGACVLIFCTYGCVL